MRVGFTLLSTVMFVRGARQFPSMKGPGHLFQVLQDLDLFGERERGIFQTAFDVMTPPHLLFLLRIDSKAGALRIHCFRFSRIKISSSISAKSCGRPESRFIRSNSSKHNMGEAIPATFSHFALANC